VEKRSVVSPVKEGSIVEVNYTGKVAASNTVFDTTVEKRAIEAGIFNEKAGYKPVVVVVGENELLRGLDSALKGMRVGEQKKITLRPSEAFGERNPKLVRVLPLKEFKRQKMQPVPGLIVEANGRQGKVQSVSGGRVRVDFNHPLAGKELEYELKIEREINNAKEQVTALFEKYFAVVPQGERSIAIKGKAVEVQLSQRYAAVAAPLKNRFSELVTKHVKGIETVRFVEEFSGKEKNKGQKKETPQEA
jgi:FKBP-type peptidyl-prolyl cis-trans isomerase 2